MIPGRKIQTPFSLDDKNLVEEGSIYLSAMQALVRLMLDQKRADRRSGLSTAGLVCGYPGSPVGGVDHEMDRNRSILEGHDIVHMQGLNEEIAATAAFGSQMLHEVQGANYDGVFALWFGKAPGVDRTGDAFHHGNFRGVGRNGGVLAVAGDDPSARSTAFPCDSNLTFYKAFMPILAPGNVQDILDLGLHGYALSRACGLWVGFKLVTDLADSAALADVSPSRVAPIIPTVDFDGKPFAPTLRPNDAGPALVEAERRMLHAQLEIARRYALQNNLNRIVVDPPRAKVGVLTGGKTYFDVRQALRDLGLDDAALQEAGIRVLKMGMLFPFEPMIVAKFADGLDEIIVVEDKRPFLEMFLKEQLYSSPNRPIVVGKTDEFGAPLLPGHGELSADEIARALARRLSRLIDRPSIAARLRRLDAPRMPVPALDSPRTPYFCSGCPHNRSLRTPDGSVVGAGVGCHIMALWMEPVFGQVTGYTQMGGEGAQWAGLAPFTSTRHFFQNIGDGTFAHSGSLCLRFIAASGANVTYKILYNSTVAMTGGQHVLGGMTVPQMVKMLEAEGAKKIIVITDEPGRYAGSVHSAKVMHRDFLIDAQRELAATPGLTVLINDQECATQKRRLRRRGKMDYKPRSVVINERVCEGCGDCGAKSNCLSVLPVETEFGRKTRIHQSSCNQDFSCLLGDCPSFATVVAERPEPALPKKDVRRFPDDIVLRAPPLPERGSFSICLMGIGGTGVVTINQILGTAAFISGMHAQTYDHTGSSQKAGPVVSHFKAGPRGEDKSPTLTAGEADLFLVFDPLVALSPANLKLAAADRTIAIVSTTKTPTGAMVSDPSRKYPDIEIVKGAIDAVTRSSDNLYFDAQALAEGLLGDHLASNMLLVGAAYQKGCLPIPSEAIEQAIRVNGAAVDMNIAAFRWGRLVADAPDRAFAALDGAPAGAQETPEAEIDAKAARMVGRLAVNGALKRKLEIRASELIAYQNAAYAEEYLDFTARALAAEQAAGLVGRDFTTAVADNLFKLMAYKDEYEVARLLLLDSERARISAAFGPSARISWHLRPTFLRRLGVTRKLTLNERFAPALRLLRALRAIRGTPIDLFGMSRVKAAERRLIGEYRNLLESVFGALADRHDLALDLARAPQLVRGYGDIKLDSIAAYRAEVERIVSMLAAPSTDPTRGDRESRANAINRAA
jgi:indolepyruvate ferredoxin oxidoreductase